MPQDAFSADNGDDQYAMFRAMMADAEGVRHQVYKDSRGVLTVGIGHKVLPGDGLRYGDTIAPERIEALFREDAAPALNAARSQASAIGISDAAFIPHLASVNFQLGRDWNQKFRKTWGAMAAGDYGTAAMEAGRSRWMQQTPKRVRAFQDALLALPPLPGGTEEDLDGRPR
ncbi:MAG: glycoside hydrolase family protein [Caulobacteraceae bacterium]